MRTFKVSRIIMARVNKFLPNDANSPKATAGVGVDEPIVIAYYQKPPPPPKGNTMSTRGYALLLFRETKLSNTPPPMFTVSLLKHASKHADRKKQRQSADIQPHTYSYPISNCLAAGISENFNVNVNVEHT